MYINISVFLLPRFLSLIFQMLTVMCLVQCQSLWFIPFGLHSASWTCNFTSFVKFMKFLPTTVFSTFLVCSLLLLFQDFNNTNMSCFIIRLQGSLKLCSFFFNLLFSLLSTSDLSSSSWIPFHSGVEWFWYYFCYCIFFSSKFSIWFFFRSSVSLLRL